MCFPLIFNFTQAGCNSRPPPQAQENVSFGYKFVGDNINKNEKPTFQHHDQGGGGGSLYTIFRVMLTCTLIRWTATLFNPRLFSIHSCSQWYRIIEKKSLALLSRGMFWTLIHTCGHADKYVHKIHVCMLLLFFSTEYLCNTLMNSRMLNQYLDTLRVGTPRRWLLSQTPYTVVLFKYIAMAKSLFSFISRFHLGVLLSNENKLDEMSEIPSHYMQLVPTLQTEGQVTLPDGSTADFDDTLLPNFAWRWSTNMTRLRGSQAIRDTHNHPVDRLEGTVPIIED